MRQALALAERAAARRQRNPRRRPCRRCRWQPDRRRLEPQHRRVTIPARMPRSWRCGVPGRPWAIIAWSAARSTSRWSRARCARWPRCMRASPGSCSAHSIRRPARLAVCSTCWPTRATTIASTVDGRRAGRAGGGHADRLFPCEARKNLSTDLPRECATALAAATSISWSSSRSKLRHRQADFAPHRKTGGKQEQHADHGQDRRHARQGGSPGRRRSRGPGWCRRSWPAPPYSRRQARSTSWARWRWRRIWSSRSDRSGASCSHATIRPRKRSTTRAKPAVGRHQQRAVAVRKNAGASIDGQDGVVAHGGGGLQHAGFRG